MLVLRGPTGREPHHVARSVERDEACITVAPYSEACSRGCSSP